MCKCCLTIVGSCDWKRINDQVERSHLFQTSLSLFLWGVSSESHCFPRAQYPRCCASHINFPEVKQVELFDQDIFWVCIGWFTDSSSELNNLYFSVIEPGRQHWFFLSNMRICSCADIGFSWKPLPENRERR